MSLRLFTTAELDALLSPDTAATLAVDSCTHGYMPECVLLGVYTDGRFDVVVFEESSDREMTLTLSDCKVFLVQVN